MKTSLSLLTAGILSAFSANASDLVISGVIDGPLTGGIPKAVELYVVNDIADLSVYGIGTANNGGGTDGVEFTFPADSASAGSYIYVASEIDGFTTFFGSAPDYDSSAMGINGDDAIELFQNDAVVDTFGAIDVDGSGETWEYTDGWAYRKDGETANSGTFDAANWTFSGTDALDGEGTNTAATTAFPAGTFSTEGGGEVVVEPEVPTVELGECSTDATLISAIQGSDDASAEVGNSHIVEAVITGFRADGFFIQEETVQSDDDATTSEGLFVDGSTDIEAGHIIRLYGEVGENYGLTTLTMDADVTPADCGASDDVLTTELAMPYDVDLETLEGMLVSVTDATVTSQNNLWRYGELVVSDSIKRQPSDVAAPLSEAYEAAVEAAEASLLTIEDDNSNSYPDDISYFPTFSYANAIRVGDTVTAAGPLNYSFGTYRINPTDVITVTSGREANPVVTEGNLSIATFNVLNYFNGEVTDSGEVTFDYDANRGAEDETEFALQEGRIVEAIVGLNADVVGLMEIENDGFGDDSAIQALVTAINAELAEEEQYTFVSTADSSIIGTDAITVGLLYRASVVVPAGDAQIVDMPIQQIDEDSVAQMRAALVQTFTHVESEKTFAVAVNHFKSKGSECAEDLAEDVSDTDVIQGSCNALRVSAAITLAEALADESMPERVLILGDLNAYSAEDPVALLTDYTPEDRGYTIKTAINTDMDEGESVEVETSYGYHNLAEEFDADGYSYWYYGTEQVGSLDHVLASEAFLADAVDGAHWNINSPEVYQLTYDQALTYYPDEDGYAFTDVGPYKSSDHDPFIATFSLEADVEEVEEEDDDNDSGGSMGVILAFMAAMLGFRRRTTAK
ncbi:MAG TPA: nuclease [Alteromonas australica]|jgi:predicted extracellular nuclease|uniref:Nuclease n=1 Tax=Alteromonas australica TaxID=589873 RepID=A0A358DWN8_9ALTE|nr:ExeM/NucH family extracellular endonuclease [Alteromonas australica]MAB92396.1 nuclease [Alteromonas sp.]MBU33696.1 nuclease [Alteromonas sp.]HAI71936.1 nuclease [Alteromonas australica]HAW76970.1 nuclease [Alteromonas australica]HBU50704.1 nuclease [Alteromonas australica]|tara:strand:+ start:8684 stop:11251 length:2568 start_codon:yes stop_codon:yes gene_type:complete